jgi:hypothetical protein
MKTLIKLQLHIGNDLMARNRELYNVRVHFLNMEKNNTLRINISWLQMVV